MDQFHWFLRRSKSDIIKFTKAIERNPEDASAHYNRGIAYSNLGDHDKALQDFNEAIQLNAKLFYERGFTLYLEGEYELAIEDLTIVINLKPGYEYVTVLRGNAYFRLGKYEEASLDYKNGIELHPNDDAAKVNLKEAEKQLRIESPSPMSKCLSLVEPTRYSGWGYTKRPI